MPQTDQTVGICLCKLVPKEDAVLKRVVTFSGAQGRNYTLTDLDNAQVLVTSEPLDAATLAMKPAHALVISIADQPGELPSDVLLLRPLLVTRVMRALDEARKLLLTVDDGEAVQVSQASVATSVEEPASATEEPVEVSVDSPVLPQVLSPVVADLTAPVVHEAEQVAALVQQEQKQEQETEIQDEPVQDTRYHHRALVVDDSAAIRKQLELELREAGIAADFAVDGEQALQKVSSGNHYDLIFLDIIMPGIDGYETCRQMRQISLLKKTPIIMLSAKTSPLDEVQGVIAGASTYLTKPVKSDHLQKTLQRVSKWLDNFNR